MSYPYIVARDSITVMVNGVTHTVNSDHTNYNALREAIREARWDDVPDLITPARVIESFAQGSIQVRDGLVLYNGAELHNAVTGRILEMVREGFDAKPLTRFLENLLKNPSRTAVEELYSWLEGTKLPITEDGCFLAYKKVAANYFDFYTGKITNKPAELMTDAEKSALPVTVSGIETSIQDGVTTLTMPRNMVDDNRNNTCSYGLHFCSLSYLPSYHGGQGRVLIVKINPADVVSIPTDYNFAKGRVTGYQVVGEHANETEEAFSTPVATAQGKAVPGSVRTAAAVRENTMVMGVEFGSRASMVQDFINRVGDTLSGGDNRGKDMARADGFDDGWEAKPVSFHRFTGGNMRDALEYARNYLEVYDRTTNKTPATAPKASPVAAPKTAPVKSKQSPALQGYNQGRRDAAQCVGYGASNHIFMNGLKGDDATKYEAAYRKGYNSI